MLRRFVLCVTVAGALCLGISAPAVASFGFLPSTGGFKISLTNKDGSPATEAGGHPYAMNIDFNMTSMLRNGSERTPQGDIKELEVGLPAGVVVNPKSTPTRCSEKALLHSFDGSPQEECPFSSQVGSALISVGPFTDVPAPVYNMVPPAGEPAELGFVVLGTVAIHVLAEVRTGSDTGISSITPGLGQVELLGTSLTLWGNPSDSSHDSERGFCDEPATKQQESREAEETGKHLDRCPVEPNNEPLLTLPTSCLGPLKATISVNSWQEPGVFVNDSAEAPGMTGCNRLELSPSFTAVPDTAQADTPAGFTFDLSTPQEGLLANGALAAPDLKVTKVTLPPGIAINPGQAAGLVACQPSEDGVGTTAAPSCPSASRVGTVEITTPLLDTKFVGSVYILPSNPPDLQLLVAASSEGVNLKLVGGVHLDAVTGQLTTTFADTPQLPFTELKLSFSGGAQAALTTPTKCGVYTTVGDFTPWSSPEAPDTITEGSFAITSGPAGSQCPGSSSPFSPSMIAGATTDQAGGFTNFSLLLQRADGQQRIASLQFKTPEGLLGMISKVPLCGEPQASQGTCSSASQIGHTVVTSGPGPYPLVVPGEGQAPAPIYLTGGYKGAPYGLSIAVPVIAGPFNLGTVVVRSKIEVDPHTTELTVTTDPLPSILDGVPTDLRTINAVIDRPGFMFNPTDCSPQSFSGTAYSTEGAQTPISSHFQVGSCRSLTFKPNFKVSTSGKTSRAKGASLDAKILYPTGLLPANQASSQSNIASVKVDLPKQLPSRLTTLQKACPVQTFDANPAGCPKESIVGNATAVTPVLPVQLTGPAYFVSHAGESFPQLIIVLQGYGVTVDLVGDTFISKAGITSSTFKQVPDVPITSFELQLPQGKYSALAANGNLCKAKLKMPTAFTGHNGAVIHQNTAITVTGCTTTKTKKTGKARKAAGHKRKAGKRK
jgi:hypothetical protein